MHEYIIHLVIADPEHPGEYTVQRVAVAIEDKIRAINHAIEVTNARYKTKPFIKEIYTEEGTWEKRGEVIKYEGYKPNAS